MNYNEVVNHIESTLRFGLRPGLERTAKLLELLGNPEKSLKFVHVAGTNGKGSTTAMLASILKCSGYKTGMYISPHLYRNTERMSINGVEISEEDFTRYAVRVIDTIDYMRKNSMEEPTQFEMLTAMAFLYFAEMQVDVAVIEVGLGGEYDATNVINAELAVIASISYDHMDILGDTIEAIAKEKAGIIKNGASVVLYPQRYEAAARVVEEKCKEKNAKLVRAREESIVAKASSWEGHLFDFSKGQSSITDIRLPLIGLHQLKNASVVLEAVLMLRELGYDVSDENIRLGLSTVEWPCRLSVVSKSPLVVIDGAHNEDGVDSLKAALEMYFNDKKIIFVFGMLVDKSYSYAIEQLMPLASKVVATQPISPRALAAEQMAELIRPYCNEVYSEVDIKAAVEQSKKLCTEEYMICVCGSLYLAGSVYEYFMKNK